MFLRQITIKDLRSIVSLTIDFSCADTPDVRQWTCLLGENGCGKSTVLRAVALVLAGSDGLAEVIGEVDRWIRNGASSARIDAIVETQKGEQRPITLELERGMSTAELLKHNAANLAALDAALKHTARNYFVAGYGVSRRLASKRRAFDQPEFFVNPRVQAFGTLLAGDASLRSLDSWAMDLEYRRGKAGAVVIRNATEDLLPGVSFARVDRERRQLIFNTPDGLVPLEELSDGYQNVAAWCGDLLYRITEVFQNYRNPLHARGLLLLDEVDLHLHPVWQRQLVQTLRSRLPNFQILATTHSPLMAQQAGQGELYILRREQERVTLFHYEDAPNLLRVDQLLVSPLFGVSSSASPRVEKLRQKEEKGAKLSAKEVEVLRSVPRRRVDPDTEREKIDLLRTVSAALAARKRGQPPTLAAAPAKLAAAVAKYSAAVAPLRPSATEVIRRALKAKL